MSSATAASPTAASGFIPTTTRRRSRASSRIGAPRRHRQVRHPARACRPQGLGAAAVGRRQAAASRTPIRGRPSRPRRCRSATDWHTPREVTEADMDARARGLRRRRRSARCASASTRSNCTWRTAICCTASCRRSPTSAPTNTAARFENRMRFPLSIARAVRAVVPKERAARRAHHRQRLARRRAHARRRGGDRQGAKAEGIDFICVSSGGVAADIRNPTEPGYNVPIAARVETEAGIATRAVGLIVTPEQAEEIVAEGKADMVSLARAFLDDPHWGWHARQGARRRRARGPLQYARAGPKLWAPAASEGVSADGKLRLPRRAVRRAVPCRLERADQGRARSARRRRR